MEIGKLPDLPEGFYKLEMGETAKYGDKFKAKDGTWMNVMVGGYTVGPSGPEVFVRKYEQAALQVAPVKLEEAVFPIQEGWGTW